VDYLNINNQTYSFNFYLLLNSLAVNPIEFEAAVAEAKSRK